MFPLGDLSITEFLRDYWQKKPLLIPNAWPDFQDYLSGEELAGLALEEDVEARLIVQQAGQWQVQQAPLETDDFLLLPERNWTLLLQTLEHWLPQAQELIEAFRFVPNWRLDDVMISYSAPGGGVGAHIDQYDVFLLQGKGQRRWQVGKKSSPVTQTSPHPDLKQIAPFEAHIDAIVCLKGNHT